MCRKTKVGDVSTPGPQKPPDSSPNVPDAQQDKAADTVKRLIQGSEMLKYGRRGFPHRRPVRVTLDRSAVLVSYDTKSMHLLCTCNRVCGAFVDLCI